MEININEIEAFWQKRWRTIPPPQVEGQKKKFFIIFAYPGISGYLHVGHMRSYTYPDVIARYKRMRGFNVLFPAGFHASGLPAIGVAKRVQRGDPSWLNYLRENGCPEDLIPRLQDPRFVVRFFSENYVEQWEKIGLSIDKTRLASTIDPGYNAFIRWQFAKLKDAGLLIRKTHYAPACPNCGPIAVDPSETDISRGGNAQLIQYAVIKFRAGDIILPCATLRGETVYGVTNIWLNPEVEYVEVRLQGERWILSEDAVEKFRMQGFDVELTGGVSAADLLGRYVLNPVTQKEIPILPGRFVSSTQGTGVVMSVPAHAPYDMAALRDLARGTDKFAEIARGLSPIPLIEIEGYGEVPAAEILDRMKITGVTDHENLDLATQTLYREEFHKGILRKDVYGRYGGMRVEEGKGLIINELTERGQAVFLFEFSEDVVCRCGEQVIIRKVPDQWFIAYSNPELKEKAKKCASGMTIIPEEYHQEINHVIDWYGDRACVRQGSWLGTEFPFEPGWIIEPISDSTLYPAYYIVSKYLNEGKITPAQMTIEFFDFVFLGRGDVSVVSRSTGVPEDLLKEIRSDFLYWYPLDLNCGGKEHKTVHFPVFIMNHVAILQEEHWPKGIFVNWWIVGEVGKLSKSKGGAESLADAVQRYTADGIRLYYCHIGSPKVDIVWDEEAVRAYRRRIELIYETVFKLIGDLAHPKRGKQRMSSWLLAVLDSRISMVVNAMDRFDLREASNLIFYEMYNDLRRYLDEGGFGPELKEFLKAWVLMASPFTPHLAEELWHRLGEESFACEEAYPQPKGVDPLPIYESLYIEGIREDLRKILKMYRGEKSQIELFIAEEWKRQLLQDAIKDPSTIDAGQMIKEALARHLVQKGREAILTEYIKGLKKYIVSLSDREREMLARINEVRVLTEWQQELEMEFACRIIIHPPEDTEKNPQTKAHASKPLRPGILIS